MEVDTAADFSIMSSDTYIKRFKSFPLQNNDVKLKTYSGETLRRSVRETAEVQCAAKPEKVCFPEEASCVSWLVSGW